MEPNINNLFKESENISNRQELQEYLSRHAKYVEKEIYLNSNFNVATESQLVGASLKILKQTHVQIQPAPDGGVNEFEITLKPLRTWFAGDYDGDIEIDLWEEIIRVACEMLAPLKAVQTDSLLKNFRMFDALDPERGKIKMVIVTLAANFINL